MKDILNKYIKNLIWPLATMLILGTWFGSFVERNRFYNDCRFAGVTRIGESAFKCDQFSKVVLLTPDEQAKKK